ncbi:kinase-like domain-containing protein [Obelidium mucronatum]|nr:kinase-like domain-containing protein [Obelidium mucronatum]
MFSVLKPKIAQSEVVLGYDKILDKQVAMKIVKKADLTDYERWKVLRETDLLKTLSHPNIIKLENFIETKDSYVLVLEYMKDGDLFDLLQQTGRMNPSQVRVIAVQIALGLKYLHSKKVLHRDIKPENVVIMNPVLATATIPEEESESGGAKDQDPHWTHAKLIDFSLSTYSKTGRAKTPCGTMGYIAPEILFVGLQECNYTCAVDMWAFGCLLYALLAGTPPFEQGQIPKTEQEVVVSFPVSIWSNIPDEAKEAVQACLNPDPVHRITAIDFMKLPWFSREFDEAHPDSPAVSASGDFSGSGDEKERDSGDDGSGLPTSSVNIGGDVADELQEPVPVYSAQGVSISEMIAKFDRDGYDSDLNAAGDKAGDVKVLKSSIEGNHKKSVSEIDGAFYREPSPPPPGWYIPDVLRTPSPSLYDMLSRYDEEIAKRREAAAKGIVIEGGDKTVAEVVGLRSFPIPVTLSIADGEVVGIPVGVSASGKRGGLSRNGSERDSI